MSGRVLQPYYCDGWNARTNHPCRAVVIQAWSPSGAVVRRRCHQCGTWNTITVQPDLVPSEIDALVVERIPTGMVYETKTETHIIQGQRDVRSDDAHDLLD